MNREDCVLFSGAAGGAEAEFGTAAERHGIEEVNFTFEGHKDARQRGIRVLTHAELQHGDVSLTYLGKLMHRRYPDTAMFKKVLQSIWHQVNNGQEIYVVGAIQPDDTVKGGTGWEVKAPHVSVAQARDALRPLGLGTAKIQVIGGNTIRVDGGEGSVG